MAEFKDRNGNLMRIEPRKSVKGWVALTITFPEKRLYGSNWEIPQEHLQEFIDELIKAKE